MKFCCSLLFIFVEVWEGIEPSGHFKKKSTSQYKYETISLKIGVLEESEWVSIEAPREYDKPGQHTFRLEILLLNQARERTSVVLSEDEDKEDEDHWADWPVLEELSTFVSSKPNKTIGRQSLFLIRLVLFLFLSHLPAADRPTDQLFYAGFRAYQESLLLYFKIFTWTSLVLFFILLCQKTKTKPTGLDRTILGSFTRAFSRQSLFHGIISESEHKGCRPTDWFCSSEPGWKKAMSDGRHMTTGQ